MDGRPVPVGRRWRARRPGAGSLIDAILGLQQWHTFRERARMIALHLVARCLRTKLPLSSLPLAPVLWSGLRFAFPRAMACTVMPDHAHLIAFERSGGILEP
jgi:hypothetical protein